LRSVIDFLNGYMEGALKGTPLEGKFKISGGNYKQGGYTGNGGPNEVAGIVHKNEAVMNPSQMAGLIFAISKLGGGNQSYTQNNYGGMSNNGFPLPYSIN